MAANRAEKEEKAWFTETKRGLDVKARAWDSHNGKNTYQMIEGYWTRHRALEHRQYHNLLKIAHAGIDRFKSVIRAVDGAEAGKSPDADTARSLQLETLPPDISLFFMVWSGQNGRSNYLLPPSSPTPSWNVPS